MRIFLDTNVLVSAFATRGLCADLFSHVLLEHELVVGEVVLIELRRALRDSIKLPRALIDEIDDLLREGMLVPKPKAHRKLGISDPVSSPSMAPRSRHEIAALQLRLPAAEHLGIAVADRGAGVHALAPAML
ncbi:MAG TPA: hypothetical protein VJ860_16520 [Polyangia bacterium]|nr:hypothetical protein [Polyangia bacterium]